MSYILEALRRSERERQRMALPSIHTSHAIQHEDVPHAPPGLLKWMAIILVAGAAITAVILWSRGHPTPPADQVREPAMAKSATPAPRTTPSRAPEPLSSPLTEQSINPAARTNTTMPQRSVGSQQVEAPRQTTLVPQETTSAVPAKQEILAISQLSENLQNILPSINIAGHIYADVPASRMVMINGQITHEGDAISPGLTLEAITPDGIILMFQGIRFHMGVFQHWPPGG